MNDLKGIIEDCNKSDLVSKKVIKKVIEIIGQEEWNDLYDEQSDICTTMGELIITLKGIPELEKENEELKAENEELKKGLGCKTCQIHLEYMNRIVDLKKENAELQQKWLDESYEKAKCIKSLDDKNKEINYLSEQIQELKIELDTPESVVLDKLDEAKEIIKLLLGDLRNRSYEPVKDLERAEDFLKEVE